MAEVSHTTTTTTTTVQRSEVSVGINIGFLKTPIGILMIAELVVGLIAWALLVSIWMFQYSGALQFGAFGLIFSWICTILLFIIFVFGLHGTMCANLPWGLIQVIANAAFALLCFISACCIAAYGKYYSNWGASAAFAFIVALLYVASTLFAFRKSYGRFPWQQSTGAPANT